MILTETGHTAIASAIKNQSLYLAWGDLGDYLPAPTVAAVPGTTGGQLPANTYAYKVTAVNGGGETVGSATATVTTSTPTSVASLSWAPVAGAIAYRVYGRSGVLGYLDTVKGTSWTDDGSRSPTSKEPPTTNTTSAPAWDDNPPTPLTSQTGLYHEVGRRKASLVKYVVPDPEGPYSTTQGRWSESPEPTKYIYIYVGFDLTDASSSIIRQFGLYVGTKPSTGNENAQYLTPGQIADPGSLLSLQNVTPIYRNSSSREVHELVATF